MNGRLRLGIWLLLLLVWPAGQALAQRVALVVGVAAYRHVPPLPNAANDASDMAASLRDLGFRVDLVLDPDRSALERAVERFGQAARGAEAALFFYAGHAIEVGGRNWLIPVSAELRGPQQLRFQALELEAVTEQTQSAARFSMIILDACRDNPFRQRWPTASRGIVGQGLSRVSAASGTLVVFSTAPGEVAADGQGRNSPFTAAMLRHLPTPGLEVRPMLAEVRRSVREATRGAQVPWEESSLEGAFYFRPVAAPPVVAAPAAPPPAAASERDALAWQFVLNSRNPADFDVFLRQFPDSVFAPFARNRLAELRAGSDRGISAAPPQPPAAPPFVPPQVAALPVPPPASTPPDPNRALSRAEAQEAQRLLTGMGLDTGGTRGVIGPRTREALRAFAIAAGLPETLEPTVATLERLRTVPSVDGRAAALATLARRALAAGDAAGAQRLAAASLDLRADPAVRDLAGEASARLAAASVPAPAPPPRAAPGPGPAPQPQPQPQPSSLPVPQPIPAGPLPFRCPPAGLRVFFADGSEQQHLGAAPGDPELCLVAGRAGQTRMLFNFHALPIPDEGALRRGLRQIWPASPGSQADFIYNLFAADGSAADFRANWRVLRRDTLEIGGVARPVLVMQRHLQGAYAGNNFDGTETLWWDIATAVYLRREQALIRGRFAEPPFRVVRLEER